MQSRLVDVDGRKLCIAADGRIYRVRTENEVGFEPAGRNPNPAEQFETRFRGYASATESEWMRRKRNKEN
ncbi:MAG TPA: hypothetical protein VIR59_04720 [Gaiellaceae bacterium]